jgi:DNA-directed RNA polymerase beta subunit
MDLFSSYQTIIFKFATPTTIFTIIENDTIFDFLNDNREVFKDKWSVFIPYKVINSKLLELNSREKNIITKLGYNYTTNPNSPKQVIFDLSWLFVSKSVNEINEFLKKTIKSNRTYGAIDGVHLHKNTPPLSHSLIIKLLALMQKEPIIKFFYFVTYALKEATWYYLADENKWDPPKITAIVNKFFNRNIEEKNTPTQQKVVSQIDQIPNTTIKTTVKDLITISTPTTVSNIKETVKSSIENIVAPNTSITNLNQQLQTLSKVIIKPEPLVIPKAGLNAFIPSNNIKTIPSYLNFAHLEYQNRHEYFKHFLSSYNDTLGFKIEDIKTTPVPPPKGAVEKSNLEKLSMTFSDKHNVRHKVELVLPVLDKDGTMLINNNKYIPVKQLFLLPITFPKLGISRYSSYVTTLQIYQGKVTMINIGGYKLPFGVFLITVFNFDNVMALYNIDYEIDNKSSKDSIALSKNSFLHIKTIKLNDVAKDLLHNIQLSKLQNFDIANVPKEEWQKTILSDITGNTEAQPYLVRMTKNMVDGYSREILITKNLPYEPLRILHYMHSEVLKGTVTARNDIRNLRVRSYESILHIGIDELRKNINRYHRGVLTGNEKTPIKVNANTVISNLVGSGSVRLLENVNPLEEIGTLDNIVYSGYGGLPSSSVPEAIRGVNPSYFGSIDPIDTPEGKTIGVNQHLTVASTIATLSGSLANVPISNDVKSQLFSASSLSIPFISRNEPTRATMAVNQARSAIPIIDAEAPLVRTGIESVLPALLQTDTFLVKSPVNGIVKKVTEKEVIILGEDKKEYRLQGGSKTGRSGQLIDTIFNLTPSVKENQRVSKGEMVFTSHVVQDGVISMGKNLIATYMFWKGKNFEDGVVISESVASSVKSKHVLHKDIIIDIESSILEMNIKQNYKAGEIITSASSPKLTQLLDNNVLNESDFLINQNNYILLSPYDSRLVDIKIYTTKEAYNKFILKLKPYSKYIIFQENLSVKKQPLNGVYIKADLEVVLSTSLGDKFTNRHAAKGVVTYIEKDENMPTLPDGRKVQIIINPISVVNRTNIGQIYEMYLAEICYQLQKRILSMKSNRISIIKMLQPILKVLDKEGWSTKLLLFLQRSSQTEYQNFIRYVEKQGFPLYAPAFNEPSHSDIDKVMNILGIPKTYKLKFPDGTTREAFAGPMYIYKLEHMAFNKLSSRSIGFQSDVSGQPIHGKKRGGGQRFGERDFWAIASYGATNLLNELRTANSDNITAKQSLYRSIISNGSASINDVKTNVHPTKDMLNAYLKTIMIEP